MTKILKTPADYAAEFLVAEYADKFSPLVESRGFASALSVLEDIAHRNDLPRKYVNAVALEIFKQTR